MINFKRGLDDLPTSTELTLPPNLGDELAKLMVQPSVCEAEKVLAFAPQGWTLDSEVKLRKRLWDALNIDDPDRMARVLSESGWPLDKLLVRLRLAMWNASRGKGKYHKRRGLLHVCACNKAGIPPQGAVRCLERLLKISQPTQDEIWQVRVALRDADAIDRPVCTALLRGEPVRLKT